MPLLWPQADALAESLKHFSTHLLRQQNQYLSLSFFFSLSLPLQYHSQKVTETQSRSGIG